MTKVNAEWVFFVSKFSAWMTPIRFLKRGAKGVNLLSLYFFYLGLDLDRQTPMVETRTSDKVQILKWPCARMDREPCSGSPF